ncbi:ChaN family lipoprotein [Roseococcus suduntuyensis]|uniref:Putative iron-regulated protein n=1 Tax=Roseococcus suduntuyensis TaxID=455361 RepID=A0A840AIS2_9PROT|nr:ChaN family lipoprotein [Roseococcus suduntuyensis]MBB3900360.1 putative iron-regulated protein [Roseococcus suduntuyensis]
MTLTPHPRARWMDPTTGALLDPGPLMRRLATRRAVLLGERHDVAEIHRWQLQVTTCLHLLEPRLAVGFEMFPRRLQPVLDRWVEGEFTTADFLREVEWEKVWGFPPEIYLPLFHFCRQQGVRMLALNCHRPLVTRIGKDGWDSVPEEERDGMTPAAPPTPGHRAYISWLTGRPEAEITDRFLRAQQVWDRAFACNIASALQGGVPLVVGIIGRGHLDFGHGTPHQLASLGVAEVSVLRTSEAPELDTQEWAGVAEAVFRLDQPEEPASRGGPPPSGA